MRTRLNCLSGVALIFLLLAPPGTSLAQSDALETAKAHLKAGDAEAAYQVLAPLEPELAGDPAYDYLLGIAALDSGRPEVASFALERVLAMQPENTLARAELARAYLETKEFDASRLEFERVRAAEDLPAEAQPKIQGYLDAFDARLAALAADQTDWRGYAALALGYDSNVNAATDKSRIAIPRFGGAVLPLDEGSVEQSSAFGRVGGGVSFLHRLSDEVVVSGALQAHQRFNEQGKDFAPSSVNGHLGLIYDRAADRFAALYQGDSFAIDGNQSTTNDESADRNSNGGIVLWRHNFDEANLVRVTGQFAHLTYRDQEIRDANRWVGSIGYERDFAGPFDPTLFLGGFIGTEEQLADEHSDLGYDLYGVSIGGQMEMGTRTTVFATALAEMRDYHGEDPNFEATRDDDRYAAQLGLCYAISKQSEGDECFEGFTLTPLFQYTRSDSNIVIDDYDRFVASMIVRYGFD